MCSFPVSMIVDSFETNLGSLNHSSRRIRLYTALAHGILGLPTLLLLGSSGMGELGDKSACRKGSSWGALTVCLSNDSCLQCMYSPKGWMFLFGNPLGFLISFAICNI